MTIHLTALIRAVNDYAYGLGTLYKSGRLLVSWQLLRSIAAEFSISSRRVVGAQTSRI
jgi:hypothetical protein